MGSEMCIRDSFKTLSSLSSHSLPLSLSLSACSVGPPRPARRRWPATPNRRPPLLRFSSFFFSFSFSSLSSSSITLSLSLLPSFSLFVAPDRRRRHECRRRPGRPPARRRRCGAGHRQPLPPSPLSLSQSLYFSLPLSPFCLPPAAVDSPPACPAWPRGCARGDTGQQRCPILPLSPAPLFSLSLSLSLSLAA